MLIIFIFIGSYMETKHFSFGHETGVILVIGVLASYGISKLISTHEGEALVLQFNVEIFFDLALPAILFSAGYNMRRKEFFKNFVNITKFGIFGSLFTFVVFSLLTYLLFNFVDMKFTY